MSDTKFTQGPWAVGTREIVGDWGGTNYFRVVLPDGDVWECQASAMGGDEYQRRHANAHLMKAAPEMYWALHEAFVVISGGEGSNDPFDAERWSKAVLGVQAALAKAEATQ